jgi:hypothetical protein
MARTRPAHRPLRCEMLESRHLLSGITLITHGYNSDASGWVTSMADAIVKRNNFTADEPRYLVKVTDPNHRGGALTVTASQIAGRPPAASPSAEIIVLLDWSDVAGKLSLFNNYHRSTVDVASAVVQKLVTRGFLPNFAGAAAELPFHLIGHSRGGSLVGEMAKDLGKLGVWVEQVTTLDPHPVDGIHEPPLTGNWGDAPMVAWRSVVFWDNYWRTDPKSLFDFTGESVAHTYSVQLDNSILAQGGYFSAHSNVHLWYDGTIDPTATAAKDGIFCYSISSAWYGGADPPRTTSGYYYSRLAGGPRPSAGMSPDIDPSGPPRTDDIVAATAVWANVLNLQVTGTAAAGQVPIRYYYQNVKGGARITLKFDRDRNPYDGNEVLAAGSPAIASPGTAVYRVDTGVTVPSGVGSGTYYVMAQISDGRGHTRYAYASTPVVLGGPLGGAQQGAWADLLSRIGDFLQSSRSESGTAAVLNPGANLAAIARADGPQAANSPLAMAAQRQPSAALALGLAPSSSNVASLGLRHAAGAAGQPAAKPADQFFGQLDQQMVSV